MDTRRLRGDEQRLGDLAVGTADGDETQDVAFPVGQAERREGVRGDGRGVRRSRGGRQGQAGPSAEQGDGLGEGTGAEVGGDRVDEAEELGGPVALVVAAEGEEGLGQAVAGAGEVVGAFQALEGCDHLGPVVRVGPALGAQEFGADPAFVGLPDGRDRGEPLGGRPDAVQEIRAAGVGGRQRAGVALGGGRGEQ